MGDPCLPQACAIQNCLEKNGYNESKCTKVIDELYLCCKKFYDDNGGTELTTCCPKVLLLKLKLEQRNLGSIDAEVLETLKR